MKNIYVGNIPLIEQGGGNAFNINNYLKNAQTLEEVLADFINQDSSNMTIAKVNARLNGKTLYIHGSVTGAGETKCPISGYALFNTMSRDPNSGYVSGSDFATTQGTPFVVALLSYSDSSRSCQQTSLSVKLAGPTFYQADDGAFSYIYTELENIGKNEYNQYIYKGTLKKLENAAFQIYVGDLPDNI